MDRHQRALDNDLWPVLLEGLFRLSPAAGQEHENPASNVIPFTATESLSPGIPGIDSRFALQLPAHLAPLINSVGALDSREIELAQDLLPHFERAFKINDEFHRLRQQRDSAVNVLDVWAIGVVLLEQTAEDG